MRKKKRFEINPLQTHRLTDDFINEAIRKFLSEGGEIQKLEYMGEPIDLLLDGMEIRQSHPVVDPTVYENKWGWGQR